MTKKKKKNKAARIFIILLQKLIIILDQVCKDSVGWVCPFSLFFLFLFGIFLNFKVVKLIAFLQKMITRSFERDNLCFKI